MELDERQKAVFEEWWALFNLPDTHKRAMFQAFIVGWHDGLTFGIERYSKPAPMMCCHDCPRKPEEPTT
jgi:hypothetical protein